MRLLVAVLFVVTAVAVVGAEPAAAQRREPLEQLDLRVEALTGLLHPGGELRVRVQVRNRGDRPTRDLRVVGTVHRKASSRFDFQQAVEDGEVGTVRGAMGTDVDGLAPREARSTELVEAAEELGLDHSGTQPGVYPLRLQLQRGGEVVDELRTGVVLAPAEVGEPLAVALLVPLDAPPGRQADGSYDGRLPASFAPLGRLLAALNRSDPVPVTLATSGLLLEQAADLADGFTAAEGPVRRQVAATDPPAREAAAFLQQARQVASRPQVQQLALPYGPADLVALVRGGMTSEAARHISEGRIAAEQLTGERPEQGLLWPPDGLDPPTLAEAVGVGVRAVILSESQLDIPVERKLRFSPSPVRRLRSGTGASVHVVVPDPWIEQLLASSADEGPAMAAQRILAETAAVYFERPNASAPRGLLLAPPQVWDPPPGMLELLVADLAQAPWVRPVTVGGLVDTVRAGSDPLTLDYPSAARERELDSGYVDGLRAGRSGLGALTALLTGTDPTPGRFDRLLLTAASVHYRSPRLQPEGRAMIRTVADAAAQLYGSVTVAGGLPVTMTSVEGPVPVTLRNAAGVPLRVQVRLDSTRFAFPDGAVQTADVEPRSTATLTFRARALTPGGTSPLRVIVDDAVGERTLTTGTVVVRSTAYSPVALVLTGGAGVFLLAWWLRDVRRRHGERAGAGGRRDPAAA